MKTKYAEFLKETCMIPPRLPSDDDDDGASRFKTDNIAICRA